MKIKCLSSKVKIEQTGTFVEAILLTLMASCFSETTSFILAGNYMFKVNNKNTRARCEIRSKLTIKTPERHHWHISGVFIVNFVHTSHLAQLTIFKKTCLAQLFCKNSNQDSLALSLQIFLSRNLK